VASDKQHTTTAQKSTKNPGKPPAYRSRRLDSRAPFLSAPDRLCTCWVMRSNRLVRFQPDAGFRRPIHCQRVPVSIGLLADRKRQKKINRAPGETRIQSRTKAAHADDRSGLLLSVIDCPTIPGSAANGASRIVGQKHGALAVPYAFIVFDPRPLSA